MDTGRLGGDARAPRKGILKMLVCRTGFRAVTTEIWIMFEGWSTIWWTKYMVSDGVVDHSRHDIIASIVQINTEWVLRKDPLKSNTVSKPALRSLQHVACSIQYY